MGVARAARLEEEEEEELEEELEELVEEEALVLEEEEEEEAEGGGAAAAVLLSVAWAMLSAFNFCVNASSLWSSNKICCSTRDIWRLVISINSSKLSTSLLSS